MSTSPVHHAPVWTGAPAVPPELDRSREVPRTWQLFAALAGVQLLVSVFLNEWVLTEDVYRGLLSDRLEGAALDGYLEMAGRSQTWGYLVGPLGLALRAAFTALLVQLALLLVAGEVPFRRVFRAALWAYGVVLLGSALQAGWLATLPPEAITPATMEVAPGSLTSLLPALAEPGEPLSYLLNVVTVFGIGWCVVFVLALEDGRTVRLLPAAVAVVGVWAMLTAAKWGMAAYMGRLTG